MEAPPPLPVSDKGSGEGASPLPVWPPCPSATAGAWPSPPARRGGKKLGVAMEALAPCPSLTGVAVKALAPCPYGPLPVSDS